MGCLKLTYETEFCFSLAGEHKQTLGRGKKRAGTYKYKYNGKELQDELGLNFYDYGARNYDPAIGRWMNMDGMSEKYLSNSPYHYADNNPVLNYDVDGNYFVNSDSLLTAVCFQQNSRQQMDRNNNSISQMQGLIKDGNLSGSSVSTLNGLINGLNDANSELQSSINEVSTLMGSSQGYNIENAGAFAQSGHTTYDFGSGIVNIKAPLGNGFGLLGHEIKHAYQFDQGETSLTFTGIGGLRVSDLIGVDLLDEWSAYKRQDAIEPGTAGYSSYNELNNDIIGPYKLHSRAPSTVRDHAQIQAVFNSNETGANKKSWLNNISCRKNQAFRINQTTYDGNN